MAPHGQMICREELVVEPGQPLGAELPSDVHVEREASHGLLNAFAREVLESGNAGPGNAQRLEMSSAFAQDTAQVLPFPIIIPSHKL